jgi:CRISPR-associated protein Cmr3
MSFHYCMTLRPVGEFFFGGEHTFGEDEVRGESSRSRAVSNRFPSQSALLGMLRRTMLIEAGCMTLHKKGEWVDRNRAHTDPNYDKAVVLVGAGAFRYDRQSDIGIIANLSPLMLKQGGRYFTPCPADKGLEPVNSAKLRVSMGGSDVRTPVLFENFDPKKGLTDLLMDSTGEECSWETLYAKTESVGIKKGKGGQTEVNAFFIKEGYRLKGDGCFVFTLETTEPLPFTRTEVTLGADRSAFILEAEETGEDFVEAFAEVIEPKALPRAVALSEVVVSAEAAKACDLIAGTRVRQRQIVKSKDGFEKGEPFFRYERGTVFYTADPEAFAQSVRTPYLLRAGINHIVITK